MSIIEENSFKDDKDKPKNDSTRIKIVLEGATGNKTTVMAKPQTVLSKLLNAFCKEHGDLTPGKFTLGYKDKVLLLNETLETYNIPENSTIHVNAMQTGGSDCFVE